MKRLLIIIAVLFVYVFITNSEDNTNDKKIEIEDLITIKEFRGVSFYPKKNIKINEYLTIDLPESWEIEVLEEINEYNIICSYKAHGKGFLLHGTIKIFKTNFKNFKSIVARDVSEYFNKENLMKNPLIKAIDKNGLKEIESYYGQGKKFREINPGNLLSTYYYDEKKKITIKIDFYLKNFIVFPDEEWFNILNNIFVIYRSIKLL